MLNYYEIWDINNEADSLSIAKSFKNLSIKHHPSRNKTQENYFIFCQICEAYEVLSNVQLREIYNKFGEIKMKEGVFDENNNLIGGYYFKGNPEEIFESFFGTFNLETVVLENKIEINSFLQENRNRSSELIDIYKNITIDLKEAYNGCYKEINYDYQEILEDGINVTLKNKKIKVNIRNQIKNQEKIIFKEKGNQYPGYKNSDLIIVISIINYGNYFRENNNLCYLKDINLIDSLEAKPFKIFSLDDKEIMINIKEIIDPKKEIILKGKGFNGDDLIIRFNLIMPDLNEIQKNKILEILKE